MDCKVDPSLYARFKPSKFKCENILEAELASLPDIRKCKIILRWSGDLGLEVYHALCLEPSEMSIETLWSK